MATLGFLVAGAVLLLLAFLIGLGVGADSARREAVRDCGFEFEEQRYRVFEALPETAIVRLSHLIGEDRR